MERGIVAQRILTYAPRSPNSKCMLFDWGMSREADRPCVMRPSNPFDVRCRHRRRCHCIAFLPSPVSFLFMAEVNFFHSIHPSRDGLGPSLPSFVRGSAVMTRRGLKNVAGGSRNISTRLMKNLSPAAQRCTQWAVSRGVRGECVRDLIATPLGGGRPRPSTRLSVCWH